MKVKLLINDNDYRIRVTPEDDADKKLLEFLAEHDAADVCTKRGNQYGYLTHRTIESIELRLRAAESSKADKPMQGE